MSSHQGESKAFPDVPDSYQQFAMEMEDAVTAGEGGLVSCKKSNSNPDLTKPNDNHVGGEKVKERLGDHKVGQWIEKCGRPTSQESQDGIPKARAFPDETLSAMKGRVSHVREFLEKQEILEKQNTMSLNRSEEKKKRPKNFNLPHQACPPFISQGSPQNVPRASKGSSQPSKGSSQPVGQGVPLLVQGGFSTVSDKWKSPKGKNKFSYVRQHLLEQEEEEKNLRKQSPTPPLQEGATANLMTQPPPSPTVAHQVKPHIAPSMAPSTTCHQIKPKADSKQAGRPPLPSPTRHECAALFALLAISLRK